MGLLALTGMKLLMKNQNLSMKLKKMTMMRMRKMKMRMRKMRKKRKRKKRAITNYSSISGTPTSGLNISGVQPEVFPKSIPQYPSFYKAKFEPNQSKKILIFSNRLGYSYFQKQEEGQNEVYFSFRFLCTHFQYNWKCF